MSFQVKLIQINKPQAQRDCDLKKSEISVTLILDNEFSFAVKTGFTNIFLLDAKKVTDQESVKWMKMAYPHFIQLINDKIVSKELIVR